MSFKPFSLAEAINAGQTARMNEMKLQAMASQAAKEREIRSLAQMSTTPTYDEYDMPESQMFPGEAPIQGLQEQTGQQFDPEMYQEKVAQAGYFDEAAEISDRIAKMSKAERDEADYRVERIGRALFRAKGNPQAWDEEQDELIAEGMMTAEQKVPYSDGAWQDAMNSTLEMKDLLGVSKSQRSGYVSLQEVVIPDESGVPRTYKVPFDHRAGTYKWDEKQSVDTKGLMLSPKDPSQQGRVAGAKKGAQVEAEERTTAKVDLPKVKSNATYLKGLVRKALQHEGFEGAVGMPSWGKVMSLVPGTPEADFMTLHKQIQGKKFMQAYETLKGGGQITEIEGQKATEAMSRMQTAASEDAYRAAGMELLEELDRLVALAEERAMGKAKDKPKDGGWSIRKK